MAFFPKVCIHVNESILFFFFFGSYEFGDAGRC